jgi:hypothetical protein
MDEPAYVLTMTDAERRERVVIGSDQCVVDEELFFVRGLLRLPVVDHESDFEWGMWVSVSRETFELMNDLWDTEGRESAPPAFGWLSSDLGPLYPSTLNLKTNVHTQPVGERPLIELEPSEHPLAVEQREGITLERVAEIAQALTPEH